MAKILLRLSLVLYLVLYLSLVSAGDDGSDSILARIQNPDVHLRPAEVSQLYQELVAEYPDQEDIRRVYEISQTSYDKCEWQNFTRLYSFNGSEHSPNLAGYMEHYKDQQIYLCMSLATERFSTFFQRVPLSVSNQISRLYVHCKLWNYEATGPIPRQELGPCLMSYVNEYVRLNSPAFFPCSDGLPSREYGFEFHDKVVNPCNKFLWIAFDLKNEIIWLTSSFPFDDYFSRLDDHWLVELQTCETIVRESTQLIQETYSRLEPELGRAQEAARRAGANTGRF